MIHRSSLLAEVDLLLLAPFEDDKTPVLDRIDETLTEAAACALTLEVERMRLERAISLATLALGDGGLLSEELGSLARRIQAVDCELGTLRAKLRSLRVRQREIRAACDPAGFAGQAIPLRTAYTAAWIRLSIGSLMGMLDVWFFTAASIPLRRSSMEESLSRYPHAPARIASITAPSWSEIVRIRMRVSGSALMIRRFHTVHARHVEVHEDDVGRHAGDDLDGLRAVGGLCNHMHSVLLEEAAETCSERS